MGATTPEGGARSERLRTTQEMKGGGGEKEGRRTNEEGRVQRRVSCRIVDAEWLLKDKTKIEKKKRKNGWRDTSGYGYD